MNEYSRQHPGKVHDLSAADPGCGGAASVASGSRWGGRTATARAAAVLHVLYIPTAALQCGEELEGTCARVRAALS